MLLLRGAGVLQRRGCSAFAPKGAKGKPKVRVREKVREARAKYVADVNEKIEKGEVLTATEARHLTPAQLKALMATGALAVIQRLVPGAEPLTEAQKKARQFFFRIVRRMLTILLLGYVVGNTAKMVLDHRQIQTQHSTGESMMTLE